MRTLLALVMLLPVGPPAAAQVRDVFTGKDLDGRPVRVTIERLDGTKPPAAGVEEKDGGSGLPDGRSVVLSSYRAAVAKAEREGRNLVVLVNTSSDHADVLGPTGAVVCRPPAAEARKAGVPDGSVVTADRSGNTVHFPETQLTRRGLELVWAARDAAKEKPDRGLAHNGTGAGSFYPSVRVVRAPTAPRATYTPQPSAYTQATGAGCAGGGMGMAPVYSTGCTGGMAGMTYSAPMSPMYSAGCTGGGMGMAYGYPVQAQAQASVYMSPPAAPPIQVSPAPMYQQAPADL